MKHTKISRLQKILYLLMALSAVGILYSAFILFSDRREYNEGNDIYQQIRQMREAPMLSKIRDSETEQNDGIITSDSEAKETKETEEQNQPTGSIDFTSLRKINSDTVGWIKAGDGVIDYPVVQSKDNDYYLDHLFTGESNKVGSIFMDYRNHSDFSDRNTIIYGHHLRDGSMFSNLSKYKNNEYYDIFPTMILHTPSNDFRLDLFAGIIVDGSNDAVQLDFKDDQDFQEYMKLLKSESTFKSDTVVEASDRIVTLCTCTYEFDNARYALFGKLTAIDQQPD